MPTWIRRFPSISNSPTAPIPTCSNPLSSRRTFRPLFLYRPALQPLSQAGGKHVDVIKTAKSSNNTTAIRTLYRSFPQRFKTPKSQACRALRRLVGYFGYETVYNFEHFAHRLKNTAKANPLGTPDILLMLSQEWR
ncbi:hypothetical protein ACFFKZ_12310 [Neisseria gonorrhoeae]